MPRSDNGKLTALLCLLATMLGWGCIPVVLRYMTGYLDAWTVNGVRYAVGALFWLPFVILFHRRRGRVAAAPAGRSVWRDALLPSVVNVVGQVGYAVSPYFIPAPTIGFVLRLSFLFTVAFGFVFLAEERLLARRGAFWCGVTASAIGLAMMFLAKLQVGSRRELIGIAICAATTAGWGAYAVSVRVRMAPYPIRLSFGVISIYTSAVLIVLMLLFGRWERLGELGPGVWGGLVGSGLVGVAMGHVLYYRGIHRLGPVVASGVLLGTPFVTFVGAWLMLGEQMGLVELVGGLSVVGGGALLVLAKTQIERASSRGAQPS